MTAGFRSPAAIWLGGASASPGTVQAGFRSLLAPWLGGASASSAPGQAGFRSLLAPWLGGASALSGPTQAGYRSLLAFWLGGGGAVAGQVVPPISTGDGGGFGPIRIRPQARLDDDEDILLILLAWLQVNGPNA